LDAGREPLLPDVEPIIKNNAALLKRMLTDPSFKNLSRQDLKNKKFPAVLTSELWTQLVASILRRKLDTDVALVVTLSLKYGGVGPVPRLFCEQNLPPNLLVLRIDLPGEAIKEIISSQLGLATLQVAGINEKGNMIDGRIISLGEWYRVAMTEDIWTLPGMEILLTKYQISKNSALRLFRKKAVNNKIYFPSKQGEKLFLKQVVIGELEELKRRYPELGKQAQQQVEKDMAYAPTDKLPRFYMDFNELRIDAENWSKPTKLYGFQWSEGSRISNSQFIRQNYHVDGAITYDTRSFIWNLGTTIGFTRDDLGNKSQETYDSAVVDTGIAFPTLGTNLDTTFSMYPDIRFTWQTELTVQEGIDPYSNEAWKRLNQVRGTLALSFSGWGMNNLAYIGIFSEQDFPHKKHEEGVEFTFSHIKSWKKIFWQNQIQSMYYLPNKETDTLYDMGFYAKWRTELSVPLIKSLSFYTYLDFLAYKGKVKETREMGTSVIFGVGLSWSRKHWKPGREPFFH
jgi:hypothetical protein